MFNSCAFAMMIVCVPSNDAKTLTYEPMINNRERTRNREKSKFQHMHMLMDILQNFDLGQLGLCHCL
jgi:hypothetical protein